jgi:hypothetical protein
MRLGTYRPGRRSRRIRCPWLVAVCENDAITPPQPAIAAARRAPRGELRTYPAGHFDIYRGPIYDQAVTDQIDFLHRHLLTQQRPAPTPRREPPTGTEATRLGEQTKHPGLHQVRLLH